MFLVIGGYVISAKTYEKFHVTEQREYFIHIYDTNNNLIKVCDCEEDAPELIWKADFLFEVDGILYYKVF